MRDIATTLTKGGLGGTLALMVTMQLVKDATACVMAGIAVLTLVSLAFDVTRKFQGWKLRIARRRFLASKREKDNA